MVIILLLPIGRWLENPNIGILRIQRANTRTSDDLLGVISQDIVGEDITNVGSNSNKTAKTFIGGGREVLGVRLVEDRLPVKLEKLGNVRDKTKSFLNRGDTQRKVGGGQVIV